MKKLLNLIPESLTRASGHQTVFKKLNVFKYPANPFWKRLSEDRNNFSARFEHKYIYKGLNWFSAWDESRLGGATIDGFVKSQELQDSPILYSHNKLK